MVKVETNKNSMLYWFPKIKAAGLPVPKTEILVIPASDLIKAINNEKDSKAFFAKYGEQIKQKAAMIGYPLFMRTDQMACKHSWVNTCYVPTPDKLMNNLYHLVEDNFCADMAGEVEPNAIVFREFLELDWKFKAFEGMPIAREWRIFVKDGKITCIHPYWMPAAIRRPSDPNWQSILATMNSDGASFIPQQIAIQAGIALGNYWSVDLCKTRSGDWYLTDMAQGDDSYHWATCPNAPKEMMVRYGDPEKIGFDQDEG